MKRCESTPTADRATNRFGNWARATIAGICIGAVSLLVTPISIWVLASAFRPFEPDVAQGYQSLVTMIAMCIAPFGALYWLIAAIWIVGALARDSKRSNRGWKIALGIYAALIVGGAGLLALCYGLL